MDLFQIVYDAFNPYMMDIAAIALYISFFGVGIKIIRSKMGKEVGGSNIYQAGINAFIGYLFCSSVGILIKVTDKLVLTILAKIPQ